MVIATALGPRLRLVALGTAFFIFATAWTARPGLVMFATAWAALVVTASVADQLAQFFDLAGEILHLGAEVVAAAVGFSSVGTALP